MNKTALGIVIAIASIGLIGAVVYFSNQTDSNPNLETNSTSTQTTPPDRTNQSRTTTSPEVKSGAVTVNIKDFNFETQKLNVKVGTTVTWINQDSARHDVSPDKESPDFIGSGKLLAKGESYSYTFEKPGTFAYHCTPHPYMKASVEVVE